MNEDKNKVKDQQKVIKALLAQCKKLEQENERLKEKIRSFYGT